jgi:hypothetical protein
VGVLTSFFHRASDNAYAKGKGIAKVTGVCNLHKVNYISEIHRLPQISRLSPRSARGSKAPLDAAFQPAPTVDTMGGDEAAHTSSQEEKLASGQ